MTTKAPSPPSAVMTPSAQKILCEDRKLDEELLARLGITASFKRGCDWIHIPFLFRGETVNHKHRTISGEKMMHQDKDAKKCLWNFDCLLDPTLKDSPLVITEGELDAITAIQCGYARTVSVPDGAPATILDPGEDTIKYNFLDDVMEHIKDCKEIIIAADGDEKGANLLHDLSLRLGKTRCKFLKYPKGTKDLNEVLVKYGNKGVVETMNRAAWVGIDGVYKLDDLPPAPSREAFTSGFPGLDNHYKWRWGDFVVVTGIPGHGKSTFVNDMVFRSVIKNNCRAAFASFEQHPSTDHKRNMVNWYMNRPEAMMVGEAEAERWINDKFSFLVPNDDDDVTLEWVLEKASAAVIQHGCKVIVIDPWNEMDHIRGYDMTQTEYTGWAIKQFKKFARKHQVHFIVVAHPTKAVKQYGKENPDMPNLYDIEGSAHWYNKADVGVIVHREGTRTKVKVAKSKYHDIIGTPGTREYVFYKTSNRYDLAD